MAVVDSRPSGGRYDVQQMFFERHGDAVGWGCEVKTKKRSVWVLWSGTEPRTTRVFRLLFVAVWYRWLKSPGVYDRLSTEIQRELFKSRVPVTESRGATWWVGEGEHGERAAAAAVYESEKNGVRPSFRCRICARQLVYDGREARNENGIERRKKCSKKTRNNFKSVRPPTPAPSSTCIYIYIHDRVHTHTHTRSWRGRH